MLLKNHHHLVVDVYFFQVDNKSLSRNHLYYYNEETFESSWEPPTANANDIQVEEPKKQHQFIMEIEGIPAYLIKSANKPSLENGEITFSTIDTIKTEKKLDAGVYNLHYFNYPRNICILNKVSNERIHEIHNFTDKDKIDLFFNQFFSKKMYEKKFFHKARTEVSNAKKIKFNK